MPALDIHAGLAGFLLLSCASGPAPCVSSNCRASQECLANTCMPAGAEPVPRDTTRIVLEPAAIAATSRDEAIAGDVGLGEQAGSVLYLRFGSTWKHEGSVARAFLLLEPSEEAHLETDDLPLDVWTVQGPWSPSRVAKGVRPNLGPPRARGLFHPPEVTRIDVTGIAVALAQKPDDEGLAVLARRLGPRVRTGASGGAPLLELYVRPRR
jgi:hypothetical protein